MQVFSKEMKNLQPPPEVAARVDPWANQVNSGYTLEQLIQMVHEVFCRSKSLGE